MSHQSEEARKLRAEVKKAGAAFAKTQTNFEDPYTTVSGHFSEEWQPFQMGDLIGISKQVMPTPDTTALLIEVTRGGDMGQHVHLQNKWETVFCMTGEVRLTCEKKRLFLPYNVTSRIWPGESKSHRADKPHSLYAETGAKFIIGYNPRLPGDNVFESLAA